MGFLSSPRRARQSPKRRAVITGIGAVSPIGIGAEEYFSNLRSGASGVDRITLFDTTEFPFKLAAEVKDWEARASEALKRRDFEVLSRAGQFALVAAREAFADSGLRDYDPYRLAVLLGMGLEDHGGQYAAIIKNIEGLHKYKQGDPRLALKTMIYGPAAQLALRFGAKGDVQVISSVCASAFASLGRAKSMIENNEADIVLAGGTEAPIDILTLTALLDADMVTREIDPAKAVRPFDLDRNIPVMGEGSGIFIVEAEAHAKERRAPKIYCEIAEYRSAQEDTNIFFTAEDTGRDMARVLKMTLGERKVDIINAHGPGHRTIDEIEYHALVELFGPKKAQTIPVVSDKDSTGSGMAAAGALQLVAGAKMVFHQESIATSNYRTPDPQIPLNVWKRARKVRMKHGVLCNVRALGGLNAAVLLKRFK